MDTLNKKFQVNEKRDIILDKVIQFQSAYIQQL